MGEGMTLEEAHTKGFDLVREHSMRFVAYISTMTGSDLTRPVPRSDWNAGEVIAHVQSVYERYTINSQRSGSASSVAEQNAREVAQLGVDVEAAAASIQAQVELLALTVPTVDAAQEFPFHGGLTVTLAGGWGNLLGELLAHGDDIATATGRPFQIPSADLEIVPRYTTHLLAAWLSPGAAHVDESWDLEYPFGLTRFTIADGVFHSGTDVDPRPVHHTIEIDDAAEWLLTCPYRRRTPVDEIAAHLVDQFVAL